MAIALNKFLASAGIASRRKAEQIIKEGRVTINGNVVNQPYHRVHDGEVIAVDGKEIFPEEKIYILLNKPKDYITTVSDEQGRKTVMELVKEATDLRVFPIGRLDRHTTGVLILTNDGDFSQMLSHPSYEINKTYYVELDKKFNSRDMDQIKKGITLDDGAIAVDDVRYDRSGVSISLHSGRNRIVRRIFEHFGYKVIKLDRTNYAGLTTKKVQRGKWRFLTSDEVKKLKGA